MLFTRILTPRFYIELNNFVHYQTASIRRLVSGRVIGIYDWRLPFCSPDAIPSRHHDIHEQCVNIKL